MLESTAESTVTELAIVEDDEEFVVCAGQFVQLEGELHQQSLDEVQESLDQVTVEPGSDSDLETQGDAPDTDAMRAQDDSDVSVEPQTREAYLKKGEDLIRSLL